MSIAWLATIRLSRRFSCSRFHPGRSLMTRLGKPRLRIGKGLLYAWRTLGVNAEASERSVLTKQARRFARRGAGWRVSRAKALARQCEMLYFSFQT